VYQWLLDKAFSVKHLQSCFHSVVTVPCLAFVLDVQELGSARLRAALSARDDTPFIEEYVLPLLSKLASDSLCRGTCKQPLAQLLTVMYQTPGFIRCLQHYLEATALATGSMSSGSESCSGSVGCFLLNVAAHVPGARADPELLQLLEPLERLGGAGAAAVHQLKVLLAGVMSSSTKTAAAGSGGWGEGQGPGGDDGGTGSAVGTAGEAGSTGEGSEKVLQAAAGGAGMVGLEDLRMQAGGRHDNDHVDFRDIKIMVTSEEVRDGAPIMF
jgi:hypothetical protein